jgi:hypothetical protein
VHGQVLPGGSRELFTPRGAPKRKQLMGHPYSETSPGKFYSSGHNKPIMFHLIFILPTFILQKNMYNIWSKILSYIVII